MSPPLRVSTMPTWLLSRANARAQGLLAAMFSAHDIRGYHYRVLAALEQNGQSSQVDIGRSTGLDRSDVATIVADLVDRKWARRRPDTRDGRRNVVTITASGNRTLERLDRQLEGVQEALLAPLTGPERIRFLRLLAKLGDGGYDAP